MPARSAALANWIARTSFWVMVSRVDPCSYRTYANVRPSATTRAGPLREIAADRAVGLEHSGEEHLGDGVDDPGSTDARDGGIETGLVGPVIGTDDLAPRLERDGVDAHPLDGAGRRPLAAADLRTFEGRAGRAGRGEHTALIAEHDLGVRADVDEQLHGGAAVRTFRQHRRGGVGSNVAGDAWSDVERRVGQAEFELTGATLDGLGRREHERGRAQRRRIDAEHEVVHDRVADEHDLEKAVTRCVHRGEELADELVDGAADRHRQLRGTALVHHDVGDAAHEILAEADLRVHPAGRCDNVPGREITQVAGDGGRADVDRHPVGDVDVAGPGGDDRAGTAVVLAAHRDRHRAAVGSEQLVDCCQHPVVE